MLATAFLASLMKPRDYSPRRISCILPSTKIRFSQALKRYRLATSHAKPFELNAASVTASTSNFLLDARQKADRCSYNAYRDARRRPLADDAR